MFDELGMKSKESLVEYFRKPNVTAKLLY